MAIACLAVLLGLLSAGAAISVSHRREGDYTLSFGDRRDVFRQWKLQYGLIYEHEWDEEARFRIFDRNVGQIEEHNLLYDNNQSTFYMGTNLFTAMTDDESRQYTHQGQRSTRRKRENKNEPEFVCNDLSLANVSVDAIPASVNYTALGYVTPVESQEACKSCTVFSGVGAIEGAYFKSHGKLIVFSKQQIISCCKDWECANCERGAWPKGVYKYIHRAGGIAAEKDFVYMAKTKAHCVIDTVQKYGNLTACYQAKPEGDEVALMKAVAVYGPVAVEIDANPESFRSYKGGIYYDPKCISEKRGHSVLVTGYGSLNGTDYWILKNSWSTRWGMQGYMLLARNRDNHCRVADKNFFPIVN